MHTSEESRLVFTTTTGCTANVRNLQPSRLIINIGYEIDNQNSENNANRANGVRRPRYENWSKIFS